MNPTRKPRGGNGYPFLRRRAFGGVGPAAGVYGARLKQSGADGNQYLPVVKYLQVHLF